MRLRVAIFLVLALFPCVPAMAERPPYSEDRAPCAHYSPHRNLYFGDLHVHTARSHETWLRGVRARETEAYAFAQGEEIGLPPYGADGEPTRRLRIDRPLDFAAVADHGEDFADVTACLTRSSGAYDALPCRIFRRGNFLSEMVIAFPTAMPTPWRSGLICGEGRADCRALAQMTWRQVRDAADAATDRSPACRFSAFPAYEYTAMPYASNLHRHVVFRNGTLPAQPISYLEAPAPHLLWKALESECAEGLPGCDAIAIPHNPNQSNGRKFARDWPDAREIAERRRRAVLRARWEPLVEIFQHKGDSECVNGLEGATPDPLCDFEKARRPPFRECGEGDVGMGGALRRGCVSRLDFVREALIEGLVLEGELGVNPYRLGIVAGSDGHDATPGAVAEDRYIGHWGTKDDEPGERLAAGGGRHRAIANNPGGLTAVWAVENSRDAIFAALRRREVYGTSGPRIAVRFFGSFGYPEDLCDDPQALERAYALGTPMGGTLAPPAAGPEDPNRAPRFFVRARRDGAPGGIGTRLERIQIVKSEVGPDGRATTLVSDVAGTRVDGAVDLETCEPSGEGSDSLCVVWTDPDFDPVARSSYYARVLEVPSCRWSQRQCLALAPDQRPAGCAAPDVPKTIRERAWTSPIVYRPAPR
jgi:hypothetical protein